MRVRRLLSSWLLLFLFAVMPAGVLWLAPSDGVSPADPFLAPTAQARGLALALDVHLQRWLGRCELFATELSGLLAQLPDGKIGPAAEGTLMLHLQQRLAREPDVGELSLLEPGGRIALSTDGSQTGAVDQKSSPEVAQAAGRPAAALVQGRDGEGTQLVLAAPVNYGPVGRAVGADKVGPAVRGILVARLRPDAVRRLLRSVVSGIKVDLLDANGLSLSGHAAEGVADLGSESREGRRWTTGKAPVVYVPLQRARLVVVALGRPAPRGHGRRGSWLFVAGAVGALLLLSGVAGWLVTRRS